MSKFSLGGGATLGGGRAFSLAKKTKRSTKVDSEQRASGRVPDVSAPVDGEATELETESLKELVDLKADFARKKERENARRDRAEDAGFWTGLVFASSADAERFGEFVAAGGVSRIGQWMDGYELARMMGLRLDPPALKPPVVNVLQSYADLALDVGESPARPGTVLDFPS